MKKRILFFFLVLTALFSTALLQPRSVLAANANTSVTPFPNPNYNVEKGTPSTSDAFSVAHVRNLNASGASQGTAARLEVVVQAKSFASATNVYAIVMRKSDYDTMMPNGPGARGINDTSYCTLSSDLGTTGTTYYGIGRGVTTANSTASVVLPVVIGSADNDKILGDGGNTSSIQRIFPKATVSGSNYLDEYTLIVFAFGYTGADNSTAYYIDNFYMDSEGYVYTPSYGVRYRDNNPPGTGSVANLPVNSAANTTATDRNTFIQRSAWNAETLGEGHPGDMTLSATIPTRTGYKFVGWTTEARTPLAEGEAVPTDANFYPAKGTFKEPAALNTIYDLYALWQVVPVKFSHTSTDTKKYTISQEGDAWILDWLNPLPQVGVSFSTGGIRYEQPGATGAEPNGSKTFNVAKYEDDKTTNETYGLTVGRLGATGDNSQWGIASAATGPTTHSNEKVVKFVITVTDPSNNTSDTITVRFGKIKKGAQPVPTLDDNTGLQSRITETESKDETGENVTGKDGQIYGFYSGGPTIETDTDKTGYLAVNTGSNGINGTYGTGTMTAYYLNLGMIYEYRPIKVGGTAVDYTDTELPNDGWREVPFPSGYYPGTNGAGTITALMPALEKNAKAVQHSNKISNRAAATLTAEANLSDSFKESGWPDSYGYIAFDETSKLPIVHGLAADDVYEVRFRANATYEVSDARTITIGGAVGGSGTPPTQSGGLAINLAGGKVVDDSTTADVDEKDIYDKFVAAGKALQDGEALDIPNVTPVRENYSFGGWTLGEYDEDGDLIIYKYAAPTTETEPSTGGDDKENTDETETGEGSSGTENPGTGEGDGKGDDGDTPGETEPENPVTPGPVTYPSKVTLTDSPQALAAVWEATPGGFAAIVFYDWDETTVLGTLVVRKGADATEDVAAFAKTLQSPESKDVNAEKDSYYVEDLDENKKPKYPLTSKRGYSFENVWLPFDSETLTHYGSEVQGQMVEKPITEAVDFSNITGDLVVKACYGANSELNTEGPIASQRYSAEVLSTERVAGDAFIVTIKVIRVNTLDEQTVGVPRLGAPGLRVTMKTSTGLEIKSLISLENKDEVTTQTLPTTMVSEYSFEVVDTYQDGNWPNAGIKSTTDGDEYGSVTNNLTSNSVWTGTSFAGKGYLYTGTLAYINNMVKPGGNPALISQSILDNMKLDYSMVSATLPIPAFRAMAAPPLIRKAFYALNDIADDNDVKGTYKPLTYKQIQYAIAHEGALLIE